MLGEREKKDKSFKYCFKQMLEERERKDKFFYIKIMLREPLLVPRLRVQLLFPWCFLV
jgi:hypothetical protein